MILQRLLDKQGSIDLTSGTWELTKPESLTIHSNTRIYGFNSKIYSIGRKASGIKIDPGAENITLDGLILDFSDCNNGIVNLGSVNNITIKNCVITGNNLVHNLCLFNGELGLIRNLKIINCEFYNCLSAIQLRNYCIDAIIFNNVITQWRNYGVLVRGGKEVGPINTSIDNNSFHYPLSGLGHPRQCIAFYGDSLEPTTNIIRSTISNNKCISTGDPYDDKSATTRGTGDQIVVHCSEDTKIIGNYSQNGGENGITIGNKCNRVVVMSNYCMFNQGHGIQVSVKDRIATNVSVIGNILHNNGIRSTPTDPDSMSHIYVQHGINVVVNGNVMVDDKIPRGVKWAIIVAKGENINIGTNSFSFADKNGDDIYYAQSVPALPPSIYPKNTGVK